MRVLYTFSLVLFSLDLTYGKEFSYAKCKREVQNGTFGMEGTVDCYGNPLTTANLSLIEGYQYSYCIRNCGTGSEYSTYNDFWQQATLWFLPWFVLVAQLPFLTKNRVHDFLVMIFSVGSPTTALYSLFVTTLDRRWLNDKCSAVRQANPGIEEVDNMLKYISQVLLSLHQFPIEVEEAGLVACTLVLENNRDWWKRLAKWFEGRQRKMEASAYAQLVLVIVLYCFAVLPEAFMDLGGIDISRMTKSNVQMILLLMVSQLEIYGSGL
jgi:hypothetical protein